MTLNLSLSKYTRGSILKHAKLRNNYLWFILRNLRESSSHHWIVGCRSELCSKRLGRFLLLWFMLFFPKLHVGSTGSYLLNANLHLKLGTWGLNWPGPGSSAASLITSSKLLCLIFAYWFLSKNYFFFSNPVYFVRSNFPIGGGLCLASYSSIFSMYVCFFTFKSTFYFLIDADFVLLFISPSTLYLEGAGNLLLVLTNSSK
jgi:hypothetical protein